MIGYLILGLIAVFFAVVLIRTLNFKPKAQPATSQEAVSFDQEAATEALAQLIRCKTISYSDHSLEDDAEFEKLIGLLPELYPNVFKTCTFDRLPGRALLFKWTGKKPGDPAIMMAHYDVVPVNEDQWEKPAFEAIIEEGDDDLEVDINLQLEKYTKLVNEILVGGTADMYAIVDGKIIGGKLWDSSTEELEEVTWYKEVLTKDAGEIIYTDIHTFGENDRRVLTKATRIKDSKNVIVLNVYTHKNSLALTDNVLPENSYYYLCDSKGKMIYFAGDRDLSGWTGQCAGCSEHQAFHPVEKPNRSAG